MNMLGFKAFIVLTMVGGVLAVDDWDDIKPATEMVPTVLSPTEFPETLDNISSIEFKTTNASTEAIITTFSQTNVTTKSANNSSHVNANDSMLGTNPATVTHIMDNSTSVSEPAEPMSPDDIDEKLPTLNSTQLTITDPKVGPEQITSRMNALNETLDGNMLGNEAEKVEVELEGEGNQIADSLNVTANKNLEMVTTEKVLSSTEITIDQPTPDLINPMTNPSVDLEDQKVSESKVSIDGVTASINVGQDEKVTDIPSTVVEMPNEEGTTANPSVGMGKIDTGLNGNVTSNQNPSLTQNSSNVVDITTVQNGVGVIANGSKTGAFEKWLNKVHI